MNNKIDLKNSIVSRRKDNHLTYVFDLDGTVFSLEYAIQILNEELNKNLKIRDLHDYNLAKDFDVDGSVIHDIYLRRGSEIALNSKPNHNLVDKIIQWHKQDIRIVMLTARPSGPLTHQSFLDNKRVLEENNIPFDQLIMKDDDKLDTLIKLHANRFFDDKPSLINKMMHSPLHDTCELTIIDAPYNQETICDSRFFLY